ncbi:VWA domain-containing protein [Candidatus Chloroploca sp. Khr17]|uniref:VWA domain-containing protein n=1 Tax=Candidatus Chloroploca sp. Khr17 TaxID=2496869 RepID=UPI00101DF135|nr:VWA domain-containing protein [Candidatus Chloroploca sp. Khr17]
MLRRWKSRTLLVLVLLASLLSVGLASQRPALAATGDGDFTSTAGGGELASTAGSITVASTIQGYEAPQVFGTATYVYEDLSLQDSMTFRFSASTSLQFASVPPSACTKVSETELSCSADTTRLEVVTAYRFDVAATSSGFVHVLNSSGDLVAATRLVELIYPTTLTYVSADVAPDSHDNATLRWQQTQSNAFRVEVTFDTGKCTEPLDLMLVLDGSGSISSTNFRQMRDFVRNLVNSYTVSPDDARVGIAQFGTQGRGRYELRLADDPSVVLARVNAMTQLDGYTDIQEGLQLGREELAANGRAGVPQVMILLTDGAHNQGGDPVEEAQLVRDAGMHLFAIAVGSGPNLPQLNALTADPDRVFSVSNFASLSTILSQIVGVSCEPIPPPPDPPIPPQLQPEVRSIEPEEGYNDVATDVTILGGGFSTATIPSVQLSNGGGTFALTNVVTESATLTTTLLRAVVPAGLPVGIYDLTVLPGDGSSLTLSNAFTVLARAPVLSSVLPSLGYNDQDVEVTVAGFNFADGITLTLGTTELVTQRINGTTLQAVVPALMPVGTYAVTVTNPDGQQATLPDAYTVLDASSNNDLLGYDHEIWLNPVTPRAGETTEIGVLVHRLGGKAVLQDVVVEFRRDAVDGPVLGRSTVPFLDPPNSVESTTPLAVTFTQTETFDLYALIDPDDLVPEDTEINNVVSRTVTVLAASPDRTVPVVQRITVGDGSSTSVNTPQARIAVEATDPSPNPSGVRSIHVIEYVYNVGAGQWVPVVQSGWMPYSATPSDVNWTMLPVSGMHYLQVRALDEAGNISIGRSQQLVNYEPTAEEIGRRQTHTYRYTAEAGQQLTANLEVLSGDADLYVWSSRADQSARVSNLDGGANEQVIIPASEIVPGVYQVEVYGFTAARYRLSVVIEAPTTAALQATTAGGLSATKSEPLEPIVPVNSLPDERAGLTPGPTLTAATHRVYLPLLTR